MGSGKSLHPDLGQRLRRLYQVPMGKTMVLEVKRRSGTVTDTIATAAVRARQVKEKMVKESIDTEGITATKTRTRRKKEMVQKRRAPMGRNAIIDLGVRRRARAKAKAGRGAGAKAESTVEVRAGSQ